MNIINTDIVIVGAGLSGLFLGQQLRSLGKSCLILEKSRGLGGRVSTRRIDEQGFDHGASYLSMPKNFEDLLKTLSLESRPSSRDFFITGGMNQVAKTLSRDLNIIRDCKVKTILQSPKGWRIQTETDVTIECRKVVISAPLPQAIELLADNHLAPESRHPLRQIAYTKAIVLMTILQNLPSDLSSFQHDGHDFYFMRERLLHPRGLVVKFNTQLSEIFFDSDDERIKEELLRLLHSANLRELEVEKMEIKKWRYALPVSIYHEPYAELRPGLFLIGDAFGHPFVSAEEVSPYL